MSEDLHNIGDVLMLSSKDISDLSLSLDVVLQEVEKAFLKRGKKEIEMPPKSELKISEDAFLHMMPGVVKDPEVSGVKLIAGSPKNAKSNLPYLNALLVMLDAQNGLVTGLLEFTGLTALRTGAVSALTARYLAPTKVNSIAIIGCGMQALYQIKALSNALKGIQQIVLYDTRKEPALKLAQLTKDALGESIKVVLSASVKEAVKISEIIVSATPLVEHSRDLVKPEWLKAGVLCLPIDLDSSFSGKLAQEFDLFFVDDRDQFEAFRNKGHFPGFPEPRGDLGQLVAGNIKGRQDVGERIIVMNMGVSFVDIIIGDLVMNYAKEKEVGRYLRFW